MVSGISSVTRLGIKALGKSGMSGNLLNCSIPSHLTPKSSYRASATRCCQQRYLTSSAPLSAEKSLLSSRHPHACSSRGFGIVCRSHIRICGVSSFRRRICPLERMRVNQGTRSRRVGGMGGKFLCGHSCSIYEHCFNFTLRNHHIVISRSLSRSVVEAPYNLCVLEALLSTNAKAIPLL